MAIPNALQYVCRHYIYMTRKKENPAYETTDLITLVYTCFGQYIHFYSL